MVSVSHFATGGSRESRCLCFYGFQFYFLYDSFFTFLFCVYLILSLFFIFFDIAAASRFDKFCFGVFYIFWSLVFLLLFHFPNPIGTSFNVTNQDFRVWSPDRQFIAKTEMAMGCKGVGGEEVEVKCGGMQWCREGARPGVRARRSMEQVAVSTKTNRVGAVTRQS